MSTSLNVQKTFVTPESKAKPLPHPQVGREPQMLFAESGNNSVSKQAVTFPVDSIVKKGF